MRQHSVHTLVWETQALSSGGERGGEISCIVELFHFDASGWVFLFSLWQRYSLVETLLIASTSHYAAWTIALLPPPSARTRPRSTSVTRRQAASFGQNYLPAVVSDLLSKLPEGRSCRLFHDASLRVPVRSLVKLPWVGPKTTPFFAPELPRARCNYSYNHQSSAV